MNKWLAVLIAGIIAAIFLSVIIFFGLMQRVEHQRVADADPAFRPLLQLRPVILSQPIAFYRHCRYVVDFPPESQLSDENIAILESLNRLPHRNVLDVTIRTPNVTDASIHMLERLESVDLLSVDESAISHVGEERLRTALKDRFVSSRKHTKPQP